MSKTSRNKGKAGEREAVNKLREQWPRLDLRRGWQTRKGNDESDIVGVPGVHLEVKYQQPFKLGSGLAQAIRDAKPSAVPVCMGRRVKRGLQGEPWCVAMAFDDWARLVDLAGGPEALDSIRGQGAD